MKNGEIDFSSLIDPAADFHLKNWARWMHGYSVGIGYKNRSVGLECMTSSTYDDMHDTGDKLDRQNARVSDAVIESLPHIQQLAIRNVYLADVWKFRGDPIATFVDAVARFWELGRKRGLM